VLVTLSLEYCTFLTICLRDGDAFLSPCYRKSEIEEEMQK